MTSPLFQMLFSGRWQFLLSHLRFILPSLSFESPQLVTQSYPVFPFLLFWYFLSVNADVQCNGHHHAFPHWLGMVAGFHVSLGTLRWQAYPLCLTKSRIKEEEVIRPMCKGVNVGRRKEEWYLGKVHSIPHHFGWTDLDYLGCDFYVLRRSHGLSLW